MCFCCLQLKQGSFALENTTKLLTVLTSYIPLDIIGFKIASFDLQT